MFTFKLWLEAKDINSVKFGKTKQDAIYRNRKTPLLGENWKNYNFPLPPKNDSKKTKDEINILYKNIKTNTEKVKKQIVQQDVIDLEKIIIKMLEKHELVVPETIKNRVEELAKEVSTISLFYKEKFDRPRPYQLAKFFGKSFQDKGKTTSSPSYPSAHASIGKFIALYLSSLYPKYKDKIMKLGMSLGHNRVNAGYHFPSDVDAGFWLADKLWKEFKNKKLIDNSN